MAEGGSSCPIVLVPLKHLQSTQTVRKVQKGKGSAPSRTKDGTATRAQLLVAIEWAKRKQPKRARLATAGGALPEDLNGAGWHDLKDALLTLLSKPRQKTLTAWARTAAGKRGAAATAANAGGGVEIPVHHSGNAVTDATRFQIVHTGNVLEGVVRKVLQLAVETGDLPGNSSSSSSSSSGGGGGGGGGGSSSNRPRLLPL